MAQQTFPVTGMTCESCARKIQEALKGLPQIRKSEVTLSPPRILIESDAKLEIETINRALAPLGRYSVSESSGWKYLPLILLFGLSAGVPGLGVVLGRSEPAHWMQQFMGASLVALAYFKLLDIRKFALAFSTYDPIAAWIPGYAIVYPFCELATGTGLLLGLEVNALYTFLILLLLPTTAGVILALRRKQTIQCACIGTAFNLPLTKVTIAENTLMMAMALAGLLS